MTRRAMHFATPIRPLAAVTLAAGLLLPGAAGAVSIGLEPGSQNVSPGDAVSVDVVLSDLGGEVVSAYDLDVTYDPGVLAATDVLFTTALGDELAFPFPEVFNGSDLSVAGVVDLAQLSILSDDELSALQGGDTVTVATLAFDAVGAGTSDLGFVFDALNDVKGRDGAVLPLDVSGASVTVGTPETPIPEPGAAALFALGGLLVVPALCRPRHTP
jgi:hypothetical protein